MLFTVMRTTINSSDFNRSANQPRSGDMSIAVGVRKPRPQSVVPMSERLAFNHESTKSELHKDY